MGMQVLVEMHGRAWLHALRGLPDVHCSGPWCSDTGHIWQAPHLAETGLRHYQTACAPGADKAAT